MFAPMWPQIFVQFIACKDAAQTVAGFSSVAFQLLFSRFAGRPGMVAEISRKKKTLRFPDFWILLGYAIGLCHKGTQIWEERWSNPTKKATKRVKSQAEKLRCSSHRLVWNRSSQIGRFTGQLYGSKNYQHMVVDLPFIIMIFGCFWYHYCVY